MPKGEIEKPYVFAMRLSDAEHELIDRAATLASLQTSSWARMILVESAREKIAKVAANGS